MDTAATHEIGLADLRQRASDVVRRVEDGEEFVVTVSGRPAARLVRIAPSTWLSGTELTALSRSLPPWGERDRAAEWISDEPRDPWAR